MVAHGLAGERMSLPQNILPFKSNPLQNRSKGSKSSQARIRGLLSAKLKDGEFSLSGASRGSGVSVGYLSMFLNGYEVGPRIIFKLRKFLRIRDRKPRLKKDKRIFPGPGYWYQDAI